MTGVGEAEATGAEVGEAVATGAEVGDAVATGTGVDEGTAADAGVGEAVATGADEGVEAAVGADVGATVADAAEGAEAVGAGDADRTANSTDAVTGPLDFLLLLPLAPAGAVGTDVAATRCVPTLAPEGTENFVVNVPFPLACAAGIPV